jgi:GxxExxY protein
MELSDLTEKIIGCAFRVYNTLGSGFLESVYHKSLHIELEKSGLVSEVQKPVKVYYDKQPVGDFIADIIVNQLVVVELKAIQKLNKAHEVQLVNYLRAT